MYKKKTSGWSQHMDFMALDVLCLEVALFWGYFLRGFNVDFIISKRSLTLAIMLGMINIVIMVFSDAYHSVIRRGLFQELLLTLRQTLYIAVCLLIFLTLLFEQIGIVRGVFYTTVPLYFVLCFMIRSLWKEYLLNSLNYNDKTRMLIVTTQARLKTVLDKMALYDLNYGTYQLTGIVLLDRTKAFEDYNEDIRIMAGGNPTLAHLKVVADKDTLLDYVTMNWGSEIFIDIPLDSNVPVDLVNQMLEMGLTVHTVLKGLEGIEARNKNVEWICGEITVTSSLGYVSQRSLMLKRLMDIAGGLVGCLFTVLLTIFVAPAIYFSDPGPIFFKQKRMGQNGRVFEMYKFRSMYINAEEKKRELMERLGRGDELMFKMEHDPRIIGCCELPNGKWKKGVGGWIRDLSIDEFPQFFNVLKGDMSLVGTRPPTLEEWSRYEGRHMSRMSTKPGITGLWQVSGRSTIRDFDQVVQLDREYIENWNFGLDLKILLKTVFVVLLRKGAM